MASRNKVIKTLIVVVISVFLLLSLFFYRGILDAEYDRVFNLYSLIPQDTKVVFSTSEMDRVILRINEADSVNNNKIRVSNSKLLELTNKFFATLSPELQTKVGQEMKNILVSFHEPYGLLDQVFYCNLNKRSFKVLKQFVQQEVSGSFPYKMFMYKGEEIRIYTLETGEFLSFYITPKFFIVSFQKRLIEDAIDAMLNNTSLYQDESFYANCIETIQNPSSLLLKMDDLHFGREVNFSKDITDWMAFDFKFSPKGYFLKGVATLNEELSSLNHVLKLQNAIQDRPYSILPKGTNYLTQYATGNIQAIFDYNKKSWSEIGSDTLNLEQRNTYTLMLQELLAQHIGKDIFTFQFEDTLSSDANTIVLAFHLSQAEKLAKEIEKLTLKTITKGSSGTPLRVSSEVIKGVRYTFFPLPINDVFSSFSRMDTSGLGNIATVYNDCLLISNKKSNLISYLKSVTSGNTLDDFSNTLSQLELKENYQMEGIMDFSKLLRINESVRGISLPSVVYSRADFFKHFKLIYQLAIEKEELFFTMQFLYSSDN